MHKVLVHNLSASWTSTNNVQNFCVFNSHQFVRYFVIFLGRINLFNYFQNNQLFEVFYGVRCSKKKSVWTPKNFLSSRCVIGRNMDLLRRRVPRKLAKIIKNQKNAKYKFTTCPHCGTITKRYYFWWFSRNLHDLLPLNPNTFFPVIYPVKPMKTLPYLICLSFFTLKHPISNKSTSLFKSPKVFHSFLALFTQGRCSLLLFSILLLWYE